MTAEDKEVVAGSENRTLDLCSASEGSHCPRLRGKGSFLAPTGLLVIQDKLHVPLAAALFTCIDVKIITEAKTALLRHLKPEHLEVETETQGGPAPGFSESAPV